MVGRIYDKLHVQNSFQLSMPISHLLDRWIAIDEEPKKITNMTKRDGQSQYASRSKR